MFIVTNQIDLIFTDYQNVTIKRPMREIDYVEAPHTRHSSSKLDFASLNRCFIFVPTNDVVVHIAEL